MEEAAEESLSAAARVPTQAEELAAAARTPAQEELAAAARTPAQAEAVQQGPCSSVSALTVLPPAMDELA